MLPLQGCSSSAGHSQSTVSFSRRLLRHLILGHDLGVGSRVFDTGQDGGRFVAFLRELQLDAVGWQEAELGANRADGRSSARSRFDEILWERLIDDGPFDAIVARDLPELEQSLLSETSLAATARMLGCLRPGGALAVISRFDPDSGPACGRHRSDCFRRHLETFPGHCRIAEFPDGLLHADPWRWIVRRQPRFIVATLRVPALALTRSQWLAAAESAAAARESDCCAAFHRADDRWHAA